MVNPLIALSILGDPMPEASDAEGMGLLAPFASMIPNGNASLAVRSSDATEYAVSLVVKDSDGVDHTVTTTVRSSDATEYEV